MHVYTHSLFLSLSEVSYVPLETPRRLRHESYIFPFLYLHVAFSSHSFSYFFLSRIHEDIIHHDVGTSSWHSWESSSRTLLSYDW